MPTIEIISINANAIPELPLYGSFAYILERELISHRGLFQKIFDKLEGYIVHLGNKEFEHDKDGPWFAGMIMDWTDDEGNPIIFLDNTLEDLKDLMKRMIESSPSNEILFSTDYQFGPDEPKDCGTISFSEFFELHSSRLLRWNATYIIKAEQGNAH